MMIYDKNGKYENSIRAPKGYRYYRFFSVKNDIIVVCQGDTDKADLFGRNDWKFKCIDGEWIKDGLAY